MAANRRPYEMMKSRALRFDSGSPGRFVVTHLPEVDSSRVVVPN